MDTLFEDAAVDHHIGRITRHEQNLNPRLKGLDLLRQLLSAHMGHDDVGDQEIHPIRVSIQYPSRAAATMAFRFSNGVGRGMAHSGPMIWIPALIAYRACA